MSVNVNSLPFSRKVSPTEQTIYWSVRVLFITALAIVIIGAIAFSAHYLHLPILSHAFKPLPPQVSTTMLVIGGCGALYFGYLWMAPKLRRKKMRTAKELKEIVSSISVKMNNFEGEHKNKLYYSTLTGDLYTSKTCMLKRYRITLIKAGDNDYHIKSKIILGQGATKTAYIGYSAKTQNYQVRAVDKPRLFSDPEDFSVHEARIYEQLSHTKFIIKLIGQPTSTKPTLILEYCDRGTVGDYFDEKRNHKTRFRQLKPHQTLQIFEDCFRGLDELHQKDFFHLDLHDDNLFIINENGTLRGRLGDFGAARPYQTFANLTAFTQFYRNPTPLAPSLIAPEIISNIYAAGKGEFEVIGERAETWSLGMTFARTFMPKHPAHEHIRKVQNQFKKGKHFSFFRLNKDEYQEYRKLLKEGYPSKPVEENQQELLIWRMLHPESDKRPTPREAAEELQKIREALPQANQRGTEGRNDTSPL